MNRLLLMLNTAADAVAEVGTEAVKSFENWSFAERASESLKISGLGMGTVFAVLIILWGCLELFRIVFYEIPKKRQGGASEKAAKAEKPANIEKPAPAPEPVVVQASNDEEIVAAITAAISCMMDRPAGSFRVVSFRKTGTR